MEQITREEAETLREHPADGTAGDATYEHSAPLGGLTRARLVMRSGVAEVRLHGGDVATDLYRAEFEGATPHVRVRDGRVLVQYRGFGFDWRKRTATIGLNTTIPWSIEIVGGVQRVEADLRTVQAERFEVMGGTERVDLELGDPAAEAVVRVVGGASSIRIVRPASVPVRLAVVGGASRVVFDGTVLGQRGGRATVEAPGWASTQRRYDVEVVGGASTVEVATAPAAS